MRHACNIPWEKQYKEENSVGLAVFSKYSKHFHILESLLEVSLIEIFNSQQNQQAFAWEYLLQHNLMDLEKFQSGNKSELLILLV